MITTGGKSLEVLDPGLENFHAGPDFFNARIRMGQLIWAGNVEIHMHSSDWIKHGHHKDPAYDNVILHVVKEFEGNVWNSQGRIIPSLILDFQGDFLYRYNSLRSDEYWLPCNMYIRSVPAAQMQHWLLQLQAERFSNKTDRISLILSEPGMSREETFYRAIASGFGLPINSLPFEMVSSGIPLQVLMDSVENLPVLEALLFGQSGFLHPGTNQETYVANLWQLFCEKAKFIPGKPVPRYLWKFLRLRPASFPTLKLSQFASLVHLRFPITNSVLSASSIVEIEQIFRVRASEYWDTHYVFGKSSHSKVKYIGQHSILTLIINAIVPFLYVLGKTEQNENIIHMATDIFSEVKAESNHIIKKWANFGIKPGNANESQALIQLHNDYCKQKRCLHCQIGAGFIQSAIHEE